MVMDWDDLSGGVTLAIVAVLCALGVLFVFKGTLDSDVVKACTDRGYWQTGQTRVICSVEEAK
jgi:hypothetical protein